MSNQQQANSSIDTILRDIIKILVEMDPYNEPPQPGNEPPFPGLTK